MSRLIDNMVQEAKSLVHYGVYIETLTPDELKKILEWIIPAWYNY